MDKTTKRILVAEDEHSLRDMFVMVLKDEGFHVDEAGDGSEAWKLLSSGNYDLLITDLYMPEMNGVELILACQQSFPAIKTILISGGGRDFEAEDGGSVVTFMDKQINVSTFIKKPCNLSQLLSAVENLLAD